MNFRLLQWILKRSRCPFFKKHIAIVTTSILIFEDSKHPQLTFLILSLYFFFSLCLNYRSHTNIYPYTIKKKCSECNTSYFIMLTASPMEADDMAVYIGPCQPINHIFVDIFPILVYWNCIWDEIAFDVEISHWICQRRRITPIHIHP